ncbi:steroid receptor RNA activator 1 isoform X2 [Brachyhypopomus gauderio]|uniref:steroid receptor RNA activator 1 isoform X2 n=1 Tax=Brachyhypopomus gauderio TaxID=698409 RepID=UPI00404319AF
MDEFYIKPGNQERGWNDPPQFSYGLQTHSAGAKRNLLNKRVSPPQLTGHSQSNVATSIPSNNPVPPTSGGLTPPPPKFKMSSGGDTGSRPCSSKIQSDTSVQLENEPSLVDVQASLLWALTACRLSVKKQVCDDIERRLKGFEDMWTGGKLSLPVKCRMKALSEELRFKRWDAADEIHRALIVDYVNEVSQWMVGVKRLIAETRNLSPELLTTDMPHQSLGPDQLPQ